MWAKFKASLSMPAVHQVAKVLLYNRGAQSNHMVLCNQFECGPVRVLPCLLQLRKNKLLIVTHDIVHSHTFTRVSDSFSLLKMTEDGHRITEAFIVEALADQYGFERSEAGKRITIKHFDVTDGSKKGDNFACVMKVKI